MGHACWPNGLRPGDGTFPRLRVSEMCHPYDGDFRKRRCSCLDQFLCLGFAQLTYRESWRDIEACLRSVPGKLYHMGLRGRLSRSTLADANDTKSHSKNYNGRSYG